MFLVTSIHVWSIQMISPSTVGAAALCSAFLATNLAKPLAARCAATHSVMRHSALRFAISGCWKGKRLRSRYTSVSFRRSQTMPRFITPLQNLPRASAAASNAIPKGSSQPGFGKLITTYGRAGIEKARELGTRPNRSLCNLEGRHDQTFDDSRGGG